MNKVTIKADKPRLKWELDEVINWKRYYTDVAGLALVVEKRAFIHEWKGFIGLTDHDTGTFETQYESLFTTKEAAQLAIENVAIKWLLDSLSTFDDGAFISSLQTLTDTPPLYDFSGWEESTKDVIEAWENLIEGVYHDCKRTF